MWTYLSLIVILFFGVIAIICITVNLVNLNKRCVREQVTYKYMPKKIMDQQFEDNMPSEIFRTMFTQTSPWIASVMDFDREKSANVNAYFISQI